MSDKVGLPDIYDRWRVVIRFRDKLMGSMPKNPETLDKFVAKIAPTEQDAKEVGEKLSGEVPTDAEAPPMVCCFKENGVGLYIESRQVKAGFKEVANLLGYTVRDKPGKQFFQHAFHVEPDIIPLGVTEPSGLNVMPGTVMTAMGPRSIETRTEYVERPTVEFIVKGLAGLKSVGKGEAKTKIRLSDKQLRHMLALLQDDGLGAMRSQGFGKFDVLELEAL